MEPELFANQVFDDLDVKGLTYIINLYYLYFTKLIIKTTIICAKVKKKYKNIPLTQPKGYSIIVRIKNPEYSKKNIRLIRLNLSLIKRKNATNIHSTIRA